LPNGLEDAVTDQPVQRRLAAILAADVGGYSALLQRAEEATYAEFERLKRKLIAKPLPPRRAAYQDDG
jgi:adenylate cyclase